MTSSETTTACTTMDNTTVDSSTAVHCWQIFLHVNQAMAIVAVFLVCVHKVKITRRCKEVGDFNIKETHILEDGRLEVLAQTCEKRPRKWCPQSTHHE